MFKMIPAILLLMSVFTGNAQTNKIKNLTNELNYETRDSSRVLILSKLSRAWLTSNTITAEEYAHQGIDLAITCGFKKGEIRCRAQIGNIYLVNGDYKSALKIFIDCLKSDEQIKDEEGIIRDYYNISTVYSYINDYKNSLDYSLRMKKLAVRLADKPLMQQTLMGLGFSYAKIDQLDLALQYDHEAYTLADSLNDVDGRANILFNIGAIYEKRGRCDSAIYFYKKISEDYASEQDDYMNCNARVCVAHAFYTLKEYDSAIFHANASLNIAIAGRFPESQMKAYHMLADCYEQTRQFENAFYYLKKYNEARDTLFNREKIIAIQNMDFEEKARQDQIKKEEEEKRLKAKKNLQLSGIAIFIPVFFLVIIYLSRKKVHPRIVEFLGIFALLLAFEFITLLIHPVLEHKTHDSPAIMLFFLVCIAAILVPLHHKLEHWVKFHLCHHPH